MIFSNMMGFFFLRIQKYLDVQDHLKGILTVKELASLHASYGSLGGDSGGGLEALKKPRLLC